MRKRCPPNAGRGIMVVARAQKGYVVRFASHEIKEIFYKLGVAPEVILNRSTVFNNEGLWPIILSLVTGEEQVAYGVELKGQCQMKLDIWCVPLRDKRTPTAIAVLEKSCCNEPTEAAANRIREVAVEIAASAVHEIRNPITSVRGFLQLLKEDRNSVLDEDVDNVLSELSRMEAILTDVLILSTPCRASGKPVDLNRLLESCCSSRRFPGTVGAIRLMGCYQNDLPMVFADARQMRQVFDNLIRNAFEAIGDTAGSVTVETGSLDNGRLVRVTIKDTGCGIDPASMMYIFRPFYSTKPNGTGLGLSVVLKIVEDHEGFLEVESEPGSGAAFTVYLPTAHSTGGHANRYQSE